MDNDGKLAEAYTKLALDFLMENRQSTYCRLYDTRSAGAYLPEQAGDYIFTLEGQAALLEVKSSNKLSSFTQTALSAYVSPAQLAGHRLWLRSGCPAFFLFYSIPEKTFELWGSGWVVRAWDEHHRLNVSPIASCTVGGLKNKDTPAKLAGLLIDGMRIRVR